MLPNDKLVAESEMGDEIVKLTVCVVSRLPATSTLE
jgi:hypothetical protein